MYNYRDGVCLGHTGDITGVITPVIGMTRISLADEYYEEAGDEQDLDGVTWLILYDFKGIKQNTRFWTNLKRLAGRASGATLIQYSVLVTGSSRIARAARRLAEHYGAETVVFAAVQTVT